MTDIYHKVLKFNVCFLSELIMLYFAFNSNKYDEKQNWKNRQDAARFNAFLCGIIWTIAAIRGGGS